MGLLVPLCKILVPPPRPHSNLYLKPAGPQLAIFAPRNVLPLTPNAVT